MLIDSGLHGLALVAQVHQIAMGPAGLQHRFGEGRQFLPAVHEVQETPSSPSGHCIMGLLLCLFVIGILWASFGQVDIVVTAPGRIIPSGQVKLVQAPAAGTVVAILTRDGMRVDVGQPLIRLDATYADADDLRIRGKLHDLALETTWRRALDRWLADGLDPDIPQKLPQRFAAVDQVKGQALYRQHRLEITARMRAQVRELAVNREEQATLEAEWERADAILAVLLQRVSAHKAPLDQQYGARLRYLEMLQQQVELEGSIPVLVARRRQLQEAASMITARTEAIAGKLRRQNLMELARLDSEREALQQDSRKARQYLRQLVLRAPVAGTVREMAVDTVGAVLSPAQALMKIVPEEATMEVEALLQNKDIGFVEEGQVVEVKVDSFNFTQYGLIDAELVKISNDAVEDQQLGWIFKLRLKLAQDSIVVEGKRLKLSPGMAVTAQIKTGKRRLIEYFLSPLL